MWVETSVWFCLNLASLSVSASFSLLSLRGGGGGVANPYEWAFLVFARFYVSSALPVPGEWD